MSIENVMFVPNLTFSLFSIGVVERKDCNISISNGTLRVTKDGHLLAIGKRNGTLYTIDFEPILGCSNLVVNKKPESLELWHQRLAHTHLEKVVKTVGWKDKVPQLFQCEPCILGKSHRLPFKNDPKKREAEAGELVHADLAGPMSTSSPSGSKYYLLVKDDASGYMFVYFLKEKSMVTDAFKKFLIEWKAVTKSRTITRLRSDNGTEFTCDKFQRLLLDNSIHHEVSCPYTPEQNGFIERSMRTVTEAARTMLGGTNLGNFLWAEAVNTAVYTLNRSSALTSIKSPLEMISGTKPSLSHLRIFGSKAFTHVRDQVRTKWQPKAVEMILVGYANVDGVYRLWDKNKRKMYTNRDVTIVEPDPRKSITMEITDWKKNEPVVEAKEELVSIHPDSSSSKKPSRISSPPSGLTDEESEEEVFSDGDLAHEESEEENQTMLPHESRDSSGPNLRIRKPQTYKETRTYNRTHMALMSTNINDEPPSYNEAIKCDQAHLWDLAMKEEMESLAKNKTWVLVDRIPGMNVVKNKWVYKVKTKADGSVDRFKARLVAKGYTQQEGVDFDETFSPVVRYDTVRCLLSLACQQNMKLIQFDVKTAFLNGILEENIFMEEPLGFESSSGKKVCKLLKSLYGLKQASRAWNICLRNVLVDFGLKQSLSDPCLFIAKDKDLYLVLYVDDGLVISRNQELEEALMTRLKNQFEITTGDCSSFCGLQISRNEDTLTIHQTNYCKKVLSRFKMETARSVSTPAEHHIKLVASKDESDRTIPYRELVGSLLYLSNITRPDICFAVNKLAQFLSCYDQSHWTAGKRILRYLLSKPNLGIVYSRNEPGIECFTDSDFAGEKETKHSRSGNVILFNGGAIMWMSKKQTLRSESTTEAEFIAASFASKSVRWLQNLFLELRVKIPSAFPIFVDNQSAIKLIKNPQACQRTMHIDIKYKKIVERYQEGSIDVKYVHTSSNIADIFTKAVTPLVFENLVSLLSLKSV